MKKALLIGGTGPSGPFIVDELLENGYEVAVLHRGEHEVDFPKEVEHIHVDPHFADTLAEGFGNRKFDVTICTYGRLRHVVDVARGHTDRFVGVGGGGYLGGMNPRENPEGMLILRPRDLEPFGRGGRFADLMITTQETVMEAGDKGYFGATMVHYPMWVYGPRCLHPREWSFIKRMLDGRKQIIVPNDGLVLISRGYGQNLAHATVLAAIRPEAVGQVYNACDDHLIPLREWILKVADAMGKTIELVSLPWEIARPSYAYVDTNYHSVMDSLKIRLQLGYKDVASAETAIQKTVEWTLNNLQYASEVAKNLNDRLDYATEDRLIAEYKDSVAKISQIPFEWERPPHPYPHPKDRSQPGKEPQKSA